MATDVTEENAEIDKFVHNWQDIKATYENLAIEARKRCEEGLVALKCIFTHRAKSIDSLKKSIQRRQTDRMKDGKGPYKDADEIKRDMVDLEGVRIAVYFPDDLEPVGNFIRKEFQETQPAVVWGSHQSGDRNGRIGTRFMGYKATHFRVQLRDDGDGKNRTKPELSGRTVEIQVITVLMHSWANIHHDLIYKPYSGDLTEDGRHMLDLVNGLVHAGEIALQQLHKLLVQRLQRSDRIFADQYELAAWLKDYVETKFQSSFAGQPPRMEQLNLLREVLQLFELDSPRRLQPYLRKVHEPYSGAERWIKSCINLILDDMFSREDERVFPRWVDLTTWALLQICVKNIVPLPQGNPFENMRLKTFIMINSITLALSMGTKPPNFHTLEWPYIADGTNPNWMLLHLVNFQRPTEGNNQTIDYLDQIWNSYLKRLDSDKTDLRDMPPESSDSNTLLWVLCCSLASLGLTAIPKDIQGDPMDTFIWPGVFGWPSREVEVRFGIPPPHPMLGFYLNGGPRSELPVKKHSKGNPSNSIFALSSTNSWQRLHLDSLKGQASWQYSRVSLTKVMAGQQWMSLQIWFQDILEASWQSNRGKQNQVEKSVVQPSQNQLLSDNRKEMGVMTQGDTRKETFERVGQERVERARLDRDRLEQERLEEVKVEQEKLEKEKLEKERLEKDRLEQERLEQERLEQERLEQERLKEEGLRRERQSREDEEQARNKEEQRRYINRDQFIRGFERQSYDNRDHRRRDHHRGKDRERKRPERNGGTHMNERETQRRRKREKKYRRGEGERFRKEALEPLHVGVRPWGLVKEGIFRWMNK